MVFFRGLTLTCEDSNKDQYFIIWRTVKLSGLRESEANLISGSDGRKMFYKTKDFSWTYCSSATCTCIWLKLQRIKITPTLVSMRKFECLGNNKYSVLLLLSRYVANSLQLLGLQRTRLPCPPLPPGGCSNSRLRVQLTLWIHGLRILRIPCVLDPPPHPKYTGMAIV